MTIEISVTPALSRAMQGEAMLQAEEVMSMVRLHQCGWGAKRIAKEFGCARNTVRRYLREGGVVSYRQPVRRTAFDGLDDWLGERFFRHEGNADVIRQELASEHGIVIGLRSVELRVKCWRRELKAQKRATVRFGSEAHFPRQTHVSTRPRSELFKRFFLRQRGRPHMSMMTMSPGASVGTSTCSM